jgi:hypothetical protein
MFPDQATDSVQIVHKATNGFTVVVTAGGKPPRTLGPYADEDIAKAVAKAEWEKLRAQ